jgi:hypothetical protein
MRDRLVLATSRYQAADLIERSVLLPVGITVGSARWLRYELAANVGMLAPFGEHDGVPLRKIGDDAVFEQAYRARLERFGVDAIGAVLAALVAAYDAPGAVLLCFENVHAGESCHRRMFATWWEKQTGVAVPELEPPQQALPLAL